MKNLNDLTVIIVTYRTSEKVILDCLNSIDSNVGIIIVENSNHFKHEKIVGSKFQNVKIVCTGDNLGYGNGNNFGLKLTKTSNALILNPDVICDKDFFNNITEVINKANDFTIIGSQYTNDKIFMPAGFFEKKRNLRFKQDFKNNNLNELSKVEWVTGCSIIINLKKFINREIFDKNFFLYFEEIDLCKKTIKKGENIFSSQKLKIHHLGFKSSTEENADDSEDLDKIREWHWMWSSFYFYRKNYNYFYALNQMFGKFIKAFFKLSFYHITLKKHKKNKYLYRFLGILNAIVGRPSSFRNKK
jgi:N-acetylglucosaminyl-diphospho-decaprenol L-rhamnosyltransferase